MLRVVGRMGADDGVNDPWPLGADEATIDGFDSLYHYHESIDDLKYKLLYATFELESLRTSTKEELKQKDEELRRKDEKITEVTQHLKVTTEERDEARDELLMLLNKISQPTNAVESPRIRPTRGSSSITESDSLSETRTNYKSYVSSPVESLLDPVASPELSNMNMTGPCNTGVPNQSLFLQSRGSPGIANADQGSMIIDYLAMTRGLPEKGKLLEAVQTVTQATPLLETLLTTGPLPQWRNPPPLQLFPIPAVMVGGLGGQALNPAVGLNPNVLVQRALNGFHHEKSRGGSRTPTASTGLCMAGAISSPRHGSCQGLNRKRQIS